MNTHLPEKNIFITGDLRSKDIGYIISRNSEIDPIDTPHSNILVWHNNEWIEGGNISWNCVATTILSDPFPQLLVVGPFGEVLVMGSGDVHEERINDETHVPNSRAMIRDVKQVKDHVYAVGMQRQVYKRIDHTKWEWIGVSDISHNNDSVRGFESIDGYSENDLYVVGWEGEIWHYNGQDWQQKSSPTNLILNSVLCVNGGAVYACGQCGVLLRNINGHWEVIDHQETISDFWDMAWYKNKLYISTMESLYCYNGKTFEDIDFGIDHPNTCYHLSVSDGLMWSIGSNDILAFNGNEWRRIN
ncbi:MAG: hypothetical protein AB2535_18210 [Candidatus Thiodiazotropha endolucinida]